MSAELYYHYNGSTGEELTLPYIKKGYFNATPTEFYYTTYNEVSEKLVVPKEDFDLWWESSPEEIAMIEDDRFLVDKDFNPVFDRYGNLVFEE